MWNDDNKRVYWISYVNNLFMISNESDISTKIIPCQSFLGIDYIKKCIYFKSKQGCRVYEWTTNTMCNADHTFIYDLALGVAHTKTHTWLLYSDKLSCKENGHTFPIARPLHAHRHLIVLNTLFYTHTDYNVYQFYFNDEKVSLKSVYRDKNVIGKLHVVNHSIYITYRNSSCISRLECDVIF